mmetsp:Transcript_30466/g.37506  ORF Transcript_30466/g.37506 Transcript_30466/m.37506 type:complete len:287 (+) Transcript_30466:817-1677(+)
MSTCSGAPIPPISVKSSWTPGYQLWSLLPTVETDQIHAPLALSPWGSLRREPRPLSPRVWAPPKRTPQFPSRHCTQELRASLAVQFQMIPTLDSLGVMTPTCCWTPLPRTIGMAASPISALRRRSLMFRRGEVVKRTPTCATPKTSTSAIHPSRSWIGGPSSTGLGGSHGRPSSAFSSPRSQKGAPSENLFSVVSSRQLSSLSFGSPSSAVSPSRWSVLPSWLCKRGPTGSMRRSIALSTTLAAFRSHQMPRSWPRRATTCSLASPKTRKFITLSSRTAWSAASCK